MIDAFATRIRQNTCGVHSPRSSADAADLAVALAIQHAAGADVALPVGDPFVVELELDRRLRDAGATVLRSDDRSWAERLPDAGAGITGSLVAVADTGTVALASGTGMPRATSLLPPTHVCLVRTHDVVETFAEAVARLGAVPLPSALLWVGGPSRTGDLEMKTTLGVHGPKVVEIVLVQA